MSECMCVCVQSRRGSFPAACLQTSRETTPPRRGSQESRRCSPVQHHQLTSCCGQIPRSSSHSKLVTIATMNSAKHRQLQQHQTRQLTCRRKKPVDDGSGIKRSHSNNVLSMVHHGIDSVENTDDDEDDDSDVGDGGLASAGSSRHTLGANYF